MAKDKRKRKHGGGGGRPVGPSPEQIIAEFETRVEEIAAIDPDAAGPLWGATHKLLLKSKADPGEAGRIIATRDLKALRRLLAVMRGDEPAVDPAAEAAEVAAPAHDIPADLMKQALRAFRKRLKLTRLDHESKLGVGPMTGGKAADFDAIMAPREFPDEVWAALVSDGKLKAMGPSFYKLVDESE